MILLGEEKIVVFNIKTLISVNSEIGFERVDRT